MKGRAAAAVMMATCLAGGCLLPACRQEEEKPVVNEELTYADLYRTQKQVTPPVEGKSLYKASYGYTLMQEQGYNGFYYRFRTNGILSDMSEDGEGWQGGGASMQEGVMRAAAGADAVRSFLAPEDGIARISGNPRLFAGERARVIVMQGESVLCEYEVTDAEGIYHTQEVTLKRGEEVHFIVSGEAEVYWNPTVDYTLAEEALLHHTVDGYYGDVHPFYDEKTGKLYMYYLSTGMQEGKRYEQFSSLLTVSDDLVHYRDAELKTDEKNPPEQELYYALGVYVDGEGRYRSSYGKGNYVGGSVSDDLLVWQNAAEPYIDEEDGLLKYTWRAYFDEGVWSGRDPDITFDEESGTYYCVVMNYYSSAEANGEKGLALYTAGEDGKFSTKAVRLADLTGRGDPECPQLKKIGNRWYLFYSVYGTGTAGNVGYLHYRVGDEGAAPQEVDWNSKEEHALEGGDLHAAQVCRVGGMWYLYGWLNYRPHANVWGGYLNLAREVYQREDGLLATRCDEHLLSLLNRGRVASFGENAVLQGAERRGDGFAVTSSSGSAVLEGTFGRSLIEAEIELPLSASYAGVTLSEGDTTYHVRLKRQNKELYLCIESGSAGCSIKVEDGDETSFSLTVAADGPFLEAYLNGEVTLSSHTALTGSYTLGLAGSEGAALSAEVYKLADSNNIFD